MSQSMKLVVWWLTHCGLAQPHNHGYEALGLVMSYDDIVLGQH